MLPQESRSAGEGRGNDRHQAGGGRRRKWLIIPPLGALVLCAILVAMSDFETGSATVLKDRSAFQNRVSALVNALPTAVRNPLRKLKYRLFGPP